MPWRGLVALLFFALLGSAGAQYCPHHQANLQTWSSLFGAMGTGASINIGSGVMVLYDLADSPVYGAINIYGRLIFNESDSQLRAKAVVVQNGGEFLIGSECCPFQSKAIITLYGAASSEDLSLVGTKVVGVVAGGTLEFHGAVRGPSWTNLAATAAKGATSITLREPVSWAVGDTIVIASTDFNWKYAEERVITAVSGSTVSFATPLQRSHYGLIVDGLVDERAEVGMITRNIVVQGASDAGTTAGFGGHMMFRDNFKAVHLQGVEVTKAGQKGLMGRYPVHFHLGGEVSDRAYVKDVSMHHNLQRCLVIHGTHGLLATRSIGYDSFGHCFFIEDGIEQNNIISWNLVITARSLPDNDPNQLLKSDDQAACFWITHPNNIYRHNVASGCHFGFWYALPVHPLGLFANETTIFNRHEPLGEFFGNKAHSIDEDCLFVDNGPNPDTTVSNANYAPVDCGSPCTDPEDQPPVIAKFENFVGYKCRNRGAWLRGMSLHIHNAVFADNAIGCTLAINGNPGFVTNSIFYGETPNVGEPEANWEPVGLTGRSLPKPWEKNFPIRGFEFYDGPVYNYNSRFYGFVPNANRTASAISMLREDRFSIATTNHIKQALLVSNNGDRLLQFPDYVHDGDKNSIFVDYDGSISGRPPGNGKRAVLVNRNPFLLTNSCITKNDWQMSICPDHFALLSINTKGGVTNWFPNEPYPVMIYREDLATPHGVCGSGEDCPRTTNTPSQFEATVVLHRTYKIAFRTSPPPVLNLNLLYTNPYFAPGEANSSPTPSDYQNYIIASVCYPAGTTVTSVRYNWQTTSTPAASAAAVKTTPYTDNWGTRGDGLWRMDANGLFTVKLVSYQNRTEQDKLKAWPGADVLITVSFPQGSANVIPSCSHSAVGAIADEGLPSTGTVPQPPSFTSPTLVPFESDTYDCSAAPTDAPTNAPTEAPTNGPTDAPTNGPTNAPNGPTNGPGEDNGSGASLAAVSRLLVLSALLLSALFFF